MTEQHEWTQADIDRLDMLRCRIWRAAEATAHRMQALPSKRIVEVFEPGILEHVLQFAETLEANAAFLGSLKLGGK